MQKILLSIISFYFLMLPSISDACDINKISDLIANNRLNAKFEQIKTIEVLSKPLRSQGVMWMSESGDLVWQVNRPIKSTIVINDQGMVQFDRHDKKIAKQKMFSMDEISLMFLNIANGNLEELEKGFDMTWKCQIGTWEVMLEPKNKKISNFLSALSIRGDTKIQQFSYTEPRGDTTEITLTHQLDKLSELLSYYLK